MLDVINALYGITFAVVAIAIAVRLAVRLGDFHQRRADIATPPLLYRDALFWIALMPFAGTILIGRLYEPLREFLRDNTWWQLVTGGLIVAAVLMWAWYEFRVIGRHPEPYREREE